MLGAVGKGVNAMTPDPVPSIPSREVVEARIKWLREPDPPFGGDEYTADMLRDLLAEVERLNNENELLVTTLRADQARLVTTTDELAAAKVSKDRLMIRVTAQGSALNELEATVAAQAAELEKVRKDAERYRWLRKQGPGDYKESGLPWASRVINERGIPTVKITFANDLDLSIDAALAQSASQMDAPGAKGEG
jgi:hypothetical protein